jgi:hypothetical protein
MKKLIYSLVGSIGLTLILYVGINYLIKAQVKRIGCDCGGPGIECGCATGMNFFNNASNYRDYFLILVFFLTFALIYRFFYKKELVRY